MLSRSGFEGLDIVQSLLIAILLTFVGIIGFVLLVWLRRKAPSDQMARKDEATEAPHVTELSLGHLVEVRLKAGVKQSHDYAVKLEEEAVAKLTSLPAGKQWGKETSVDRDNPQEVLEFVQRYKNYCSPTFGDKRDELVEFFTEMRTLASKRSFSLPPVYNVLLTLLVREREKENFLELLEVLSSFADRDHDFTPKDRRMRLVVAGLTELAKSALRNKGFLQGSKTERQQGIEKFRRTTEEVFHRISDISSAKDEDSNTSRVLELECLKDFLRTLLQIARQIGMEEADKPNFEIKLYDQTGDVIVSSEIVTLRFLITDTRSVPKLSHISIIPSLNSTEFTYEGGNRRDVELNNGSEIVAFSFRSYIFNQSEVRHKFTVKFTIEYSLVQMKGVQEVEVVLPVVAVPRISNPFLIGIQGSGLPGESPLFVGRDKLLREISENFVNFDAEALYFVIYGSSRAGKSSVLRQFSENPKWLKQLYIPVPLSAEASQRPEGFFREIYDTLYSSLSKRIHHVKQPEKRFLQDDFQPLHTRIIELIRLNEEELTERKQRVLFLIDEYQRLAEWEKRVRSADEISQLQTGYFQVPELLKILSDKYRRVTAVLLFGLHPLEDIAKYSRNRHWVSQLGGRVAHRKIENFTNDEADKLLVNTLESCSLHITPESLERVRNYTAGQPFLHMLLGYHTFNAMLGENSFRGDKMVNIQDIDHAALKIHGADMKFLFAESWVYEHPETRLFLAAVGEQSRDFALERNDATMMPELSVNDVKDYLFSRYAIDYRKFDFTHAVVPLCDRGILREVRAGVKKKWILVYPLFSIYASMSHLVSQVLGELSEPQGA